MNNPEIATPKRMKTTPPAAHIPVMEEEEEAKVKRKKKSRPLCVFLALTACLSALVYGAIIIWLSAVVDPKTPVFIGALMILGGVSMAAGLAGVLGVLQQHPVALQVSRIVLSGTAPLTILLTIMCFLDLMGWIRGDGQLSRFFAMNYSEGVAGCLTGFLVSLYSLCSLTSLAKLQTDAELRQIRRERRQLERLLVGDTETGESAGGSRLQTQEGEGGTKTVYEEEEASTSESSGLLEEGSKGPEST